MAQRPEAERTQQSVNKELILKKEALSEIAKLLKEKEKETLATQERLQKLIKELDDLETANRLIEEYKEKYMRLEEAMKQKLNEFNQHELENKLRTKKTAEEYKKQVHIKDTTIKELNDKLRNMEIKCKEIEEELIKVKELNEELLKDSGISVNFNLFADEPIADIEEIKRLKEENKKYKMEIDNFDETKKGIEDQVCDLQKEILSLEEKYAKELCVKCEAIKNIENIIRDTNEQMIQSKAKEIDLQKQLTDSHTQIRSKAREIEVLEQKKKEMKAEIKTLIVKCQCLKSEITQKDFLIKQQHQNIELLQYEVAMKQAEILRINEERNNLAAQIKAKRVVLTNAQLKIKELNRNIVSSLQVNAEDRDRTIIILKELLKGHHNELNMKNKDIRELKKDLAQVKSLNNNILVPTEPSLIKVKTKEVQAKPSRNTSKESTIESKVNMISLKPSIPTYKERYMKLYDEYSNTINVRNRKNNSTNVKNVLSYDRCLSYSRTPVIDKCNKSEVINNFKTIAEGSEANIEAILKNALLKKEPERSLEFAARINRLFNYSESPYASKKAKGRLKRLLFT